MRLSGATATAATCSTAIATYSTVASASISTTGNSLVGTVSHSDLSGYGKINLANSANTTSKQYKIFAALDGETVSFQPRTIKRSSPVTKFECKWN